MSLIDRLSGADRANKIPVHQFYAGFIGLLLGQVTKDDLRQEFGVRAEDMADWAWLMGSYDRALNKGMWRDALHAAGMWAEQSRGNMKSAAAFKAWMQAAELIA